MTAMGVWAFGRAWGPWETLTGSVSMNNQRLGLVFNGRGHLEG
jgi:hypothetical protein